MKFRFPVVIIDEDWRADTASGLGIRALGKALEEEGMEVIGGFTYRLQRPKYRFRRSLR